MCLFWIGLWNAELIIHVILNTVRRISIYFSTIVWNNISIFIVVMIQRWFCVYRIHYTFCKCLFRYYITIWLICQTRRRLWKLLVLILTFRERDLTLCKFRIKIILISITLSIEIKFSVSIRECILLNIPFVLDIFHLKFSHFLFRLIKALLTHGNLSWSRIPLYSV